MSVERAIAAAGKGGRTFPIALLGRDVVAVGGDVDGLDATRVGACFDNEDGWEGVQWRTQAHMRE